MYLLLDECCSKALVPVAQAHGHRVERTIHISSLGRGAADDAIFAFARSQDAVLVTINRDDFVALARYGNGHPGVIVLPSVKRAELVALFERILPIAEAIFDAGGNKFVEIDSGGRVISFALP